LHINSPGLRFLMHMVSMGNTNTCSAVADSQCFWGGTNKIYWVDIKKLEENTNYIYFISQVGGDLSPISPPWIRYVLNHSLLLENLPCRFYKFDINSTGRSVLFGLPTTLLVNSFALQLFVLNIINSIYYNKCCLKSFLYWNISEFDFKLNLYLVKMGKVNSELI